MNDVISNSYTFRNNLFEIAYVKFYYKYNSNCFKEYIIHMYLSIVRGCPFLLICIPKSKNECCVYIVQNLYDIHLLGHVDIAGLNHQSCHCDK